MAVAQADYASKACEASTFTSWFDTGAFPIGVGDGIDGAGEGHTDAEMRGDPMAALRSE